MTHLRAGATRLKRGAKRGLDRLLTTPAPAPSRAGRGRPLVAGLLTSSSGLGRAARMTFAALAERGFNPAAIDLTPRFAAHASDTAFDAPGPESGDDGPVILQVNPPETFLALRAVGRPTLARRYRVGYWVYELDTPPASWRSARPMVNEAWAPSTFSARALGAVFPPGVAALPHPAAALTRRAPPDAAAAVRTRLAGAAAFVVGTAADGRSSLARKNPEAAVAAFQHAFPDDPGARLLVHVTNGEFSPTAFGRLNAAAAADARIVLSTEPLSDVEMTAFLGACDAWVSLHRAEGFGLTVAEALLAGRPVVATDGTGAADFLHLPGVAIAPARDVAVDDPEGPYQGVSGTWKEPDAAAAALALTAARLQPANAGEIRRAAEDHFGAAAFERALTPSFLAHVDR